MSSVLLAVVFALLGLSCVYAKLGWDTIANAAWVARLLNPKPWHAGVIPWRIRK